MATIKKLHDEYYISAFNSIESYVLTENNKSIPIYILNQSGLLYLLFIGLKSLIDEDGINVSKYFDVNRETVKEKEELEDDWKGLTEYVLSICKQKNIL